MIWFLLIIASIVSLRIYARWLGYFNLLTRGKQGSPFDVPRDWNWTPKVTFMIPSFNESKVVCDGIDSIMASDYPKEQIEIISVDDCSGDDTYEWIKRMRDKYPDNVVCWKNNPNKGKSYTLIDIVQQAKGEIVFTVDSDTVIAPNTIREIVSCYADPDMGGVGGFVLCKNLNDSLWTQMQGMLFAHYYYLTKVFENQFRSVRVLSGQIASFRRSVFLECIPLIHSREILGVSPIRCAEDTYLSTRIGLGDGLAKRWKLFNNFKALAWTNNPANFEGYLKQQLRWWRSASVGFMVFGKLYENIKRAGVVPVGITTITSVGILMLVSLLMYFISIGFLPQLLVLVLLNSSLTGIISCLTYNHIIGRHDKIAGKIKHPILTGIWFGIWVQISWLSLSIIALFTLDDGGWVTRSKGNF